MSSTKYSKITPEQMNGLMEAIAKLQLPITTYELGVLFITRTLVAEYLSGANHADLGESIAAVFSDIMLSYSASVAANIPKEELN